MTGVAADARADRWRDRVTDTGPVFRPRVEAGIRACYEAAGRRPPRAVAWVRSPREARRLMDPRRRARLLDRLAEPRAGRWRRWARTRRARIEQTALRCAIVAGGLALLVGVTVVAVRAGHGWQVATGAADLDRTGPAALWTLAATVVVALLGGLGGALAGLLAPGPAELAAVSERTGLRERLQSYPGVVPAGLPVTPRGPGSVSWWPTGPDGRRPPNPVSRRLRELALSHRDPLVPLGGRQPRWADDLLAAYERGELGSVDGRLVTAYADAGDA